MESALKALEQETSRPSKLRTVAHSFQGMVALGCPLGKDEFVAEELGFEKGSRNALIAVQDYGPLCT